MRLELRDITKRFPGVLANDKISISADRGKVLGLLGENGAGKTTLMNILSGPVQAGLGPDRHRRRGARLRGSRRGHPRRRRDGPPALHARPGVRRRRGRGPRAPRPSPIASAPSIAPRRGSGSSSCPTSTGSDVDPDAKIENLPVGVRQRVEILKALYRHSDILVLDEPSAVLTPFETEELFGIIRSLTATGTTIIFITHKLNEVLEVADDVVVLRRGRVAGTRRPEDRHPPGAGQPDGRARRRADRPQGPREPGRGRAEPARRPGPRRPPGARRRRRRPRGPGRRDRRHRGRPGQRPDGARRGDRRAAPVRRRRGDDRGPSHREGVAARGLGPRRRPHPRGPGSRRPDRHDDRRRELHPRHLPPRAVQPPRDPRPRGHRRRARRKGVKEFDIRTPSIETHGRLAVRRQPAEGRRGARVLGAGQARARGPADARPGCRLDRVHPPPAHRAARCRRGDPASSARSSTRSSRSATGSP